jgi:hypothetical protein
MKKSHIIVIVVILAVIGIFIGMHALEKRVGGAYKLAEQMKSQGLDYNKMDVAQSTSMYEEILLSGVNLQVKIDHFGNGLFLKQVKDNLIKDKKQSGSKMRIFLAGAYVVVVAQEPSKDLVKSILLKFFPVVEEF